MIQIEISRYFTQHLQILYWDMDEQNEKICAICGTTIPPQALGCAECGGGVFKTEKFHSHRGSVAYPSPGPFQKVGGHNYFEESVPGGDGLCSDNECPCSPSTVIPHGSGYLYIDQTIVDWRRLYPRFEDAHRAMGVAMKQSLSKESSALGIPLSGVYRTGPILVCEQGARLRKLDLKIAAADAKHWWKTGQVPLRVTPLKKWYQI